MNSRTALAVLTTAGLCLGGVATAHADGTTTPVASSTSTTTVTEVAPTSTVTVTKDPTVSDKIVAASTLSEEGQKFFTVLSTVIAVLGGLTQVAAIVVAANPQIGVDVAVQITNWLNQMGIRF
ncbi:hypothetical protein [Corynebacterium bouchesdurhonense]|uniref:hypothetical protein n=1 Tax=Corynebacterium bouchesdurhonense TaxID=1720192 RepID=UPI000B26CCFF|nr:hypothetical protein [Corynebacterium bouchesdurhonense]